MNDFVSNPTEVVKVGEPLPNSYEINKALEKGELYKRGFKDGYKQAIIDGKTNFSRQQGEWEATNETDLFSGLVYKCTQCGKETLACDCHNFCTWCGAQMKGGEENGKS